MASRRSYEDEVNKISISIFITNFPDQFYAKDLWRVCNQYGKVIDAFIPNRRTKSGKRFGFVRFIKVLDVDRLVNNICTIWVECFKLHANLARFQRTSLNNNHSQQPNKAEKGGSVDGNKDSGSNGHTNSYIHAVKRGIQFHNVEDENKPAIVLDESCLNQKDYSTAVMGKVKEFSSLTNLKIVLANEGFENIKLRYMGGYWVMIEFLDKDSKISSTLTWAYDPGKVFWIRAKEVSSWVPDFVEDEEEDSDSEDGSIEEGPYSENVDKQEEVNSEEGDVEEVSKTIFEKEQDQVPKEDNFNIGENGCNSEDPFNNYGLLNKKQKNLNDGPKSNDTMKYPPRFTPMTNVDSQSNDLKGVGKEGVETLKNDQEEK
ncbi:nucleotide-binding alpha-beta plait domain-containing protein [Tanacetum coccineum]